MRADSHVRAVGIPHLHGSGVSGEVERQVEGKTHGTKEALAGAVLSVHIKINDIATWPDTEELLQKVLVLYLIGQRWIGGAAGYWQWRGLAERLSESLSQVETRRWNSHDPDAHRLDEGT